MKTHHILPSIQSMDWLVLTSVLCFLLVPASTSAACEAGEVDIAFTTTQDWGTGFQAAVSITNHADWTVWDWRLAFDFAYAIGNIWDASVQSHDADHYTIVGKWTPHIAPGETVSFGFIGSPGGGVVAPADGQLNGAACVFNGCSSAPPALAPREPPTWPGRVFAPYVDATLWPTFDLVQVAQDEGVQFFTLGFIVAKSAADPTPSWGTYYTVDEGFLLSAINALRDLGGDVMVSFGGAANIELAAAHNSVADLAQAYQQVIDAYQLTHVDFDIEGAWVADTASVERRSQAIAALQADAVQAGRMLRVWYTLPVLPTGLTLDGLSVLQSALAHGVEIAGVNIMAMDYGDGAAPNPDGQMGTYAIQAATSLFGQLQNLYVSAGIPRTVAQLWRMIGVTPMIGRNDVTTEVFAQADAQVLLNFAQQKAISLLSFWSANRDQQCAEGPLSTVSPSCSSISQTPFEFTSIFLPFTGSSVVPRLSITPASLDFGAVVLNDPTVRELTLSNIGTADLTIDSITSTLGSILVLSQSTLMLEPDASKVIELTLTANAVGPISGALTFVSNDPDSPDQIPVSAQATYHVADLSANGTVSAHDASLILQYVVGLIDRFPVEDILTSSPGHSQPRTYQLQLPQVQLRAGESTFISLHISDLEGLLAGGLTLAYDPGVLRVVDVICPLRQTYWETNLERAGEVRFAFVRVPGETSPGARLLLIEVEALPGSEGKVSELMLRDIQLADSLSIQTVAGLVTVLPGVTQLYPNYPNPFNPETWIPYQLAEDTDMTLRIFDMTGQLIRTLKSGEQPAGVYMSRERAAYWDGRNVIGESVASGVYFYQLVTPAFQQMRRMVVVR